MTIDEIDNIVDMFSVHRPKGRAKGTLARREMKNKLSRAVQALIDAAVVEARISELNRKITMNIELVSSADFKAGFNEALDQIDKINDIRIAALSKRQHHG